ncbi:unannotated protein [freshwater metagenome]|uniref:Unannotated protein n=1 Tax=freshwater metagenome TaxID=449393 RepID=A0A6J7HUA3_9ZZZZ
MPQVLFNARAAARPELGGVERWARELEQRLPLLDADRYAVSRPPRALAHRAGHLWEQAVLPLDAARRRTPLILSPANLAPVAWRANVVVIHDAAALRDPSWYSQAYARWQRRVLPRIAQGALAVIVPSAFSRDEVVELLGAQPGRVHVVPGGVDPRFTPQADAARAAHALGLARPYILTVASRTARKNLAALDGLASRLAPDGIDVVLAGGGRPQFREDGGAAARVRALGHVDDALLPGLYAGARAFVLPSRHEGFGLTAVEAMASGVPTLVSAAGALPETCGDGAHYVHATDAESLERGVSAALAVAGLAARGVARAATFTWDRTAREVDAVVSAALAARRRRGPAAG